jgi:hypothetical protein
MPETAGRAGLKVNLISFEDSRDLSIGDMINRGDVAV